MLSGSLLCITTSMICCMWQKWPKWLLSTVGVFAGEQYSSPPHPRWASLVSLCIIPRTCRAKLCFALIDSEWFFPIWRLIFGPDLLLRDRFSVKAVIRLQASRTRGSAHFCQGAGWPRCQLAAEEFLLFYLSYSITCARITLSVFLSLTIVCSLCESECMFVFEAG